jgi:hypothetical protein
MSGLISTSASTTAPRAVVKSTVTSVLIQIFLTSTLSAQPPPRRRDHSRNRPAGPGRSLDLSPCRLRRAFVPVEKEGRGHAGADIGLELSGVPEVVLESEGWRQQPDIAEVDSGIGQGARYGHVDGADIVRCDSKDQLRGNSVGEEVCEVELGDILLTDIAVVREACAANRQRGRFVRQHGGRAREASRDWLPQRGLRQIRSGMCPSAGRQEGVSSSLRSRHSGE